MAYLLLSVYFLVWAVCDLTDAPLFRGRLTEEVTDRARFRKMRAVSELVFCMTLFAHFVLEQRYGVKIPGPWTLLIYGAECVLLVLWNLMWKRRCQ